MNGYYVIAAACFIISAFGFGFMAGRANEAARVKHEIERISQRYEDGEFDER